ncbi:hypothetical protein Bca52824_047100 [Brassica carinata]|uniref:Uncharacterized protein n=1 Tax=Brassica carinata TaxID=52824 RepID=A0A8X7UT01_BRACI|nr:hypothetical protein Bca52824_047100 [Brassica carinata]
MIFDLEETKRKGCHFPNTPDSPMLLIQMDLMFYLQSLMKLPLTPNLHFLLDMCPLHPKMEAKKEAREMISR